MTPFGLGQLDLLRTREGREKSGLYVIEGVRFLVTAVDGGATIEGLVVCPALLQSTVGQVVARRLRRAGVPLLRVGEAEYSALARMTDGSGRGVIAVARQRWSRIDFLRPRDLWLAVEAIRSPGNLGSLIRTGVAVGIRGVIALGDVDLHDPACVRATMGGLHALELIHMSGPSLLDLTRRSCARLVAASPDGEVDYRAASYRGATVLLVGSEREGVSMGMRQACDTTVRIPMSGRLDSLNLAVAGSLVLYEAFGQRTGTRRFRRLR